MKKLPRNFYNRNTMLVAQEMLGKYIVHQDQGVERVGKIVEVEAYLGPHDLAAHTSKGRTKRTEVMFGPAGHAYVYLIYGMYHCINAVTEEEGHGSAVLLRALEPVKNISRAGGPGLLCNALGINRSHNGHDLLSDNLCLIDPGISNFKIIKRPRVGVDYAKHWSRRLLRFYIKDNPYISKK